MSVNANKLAFAENLMRTVFEEALAGIAIQMGNIFFTMRMLCQYTLLVRQHAPLTQFWGHVDPFDLMLGVAKMQLCSMPHLASPIIIEDKQTYKSL